MDTKRCTSCFQAKEPTKFYRPRGTNSSAEHSTCNECFQRRKEQRETNVSSRKKQKLADPHTSAPTSTALTRASSASSSTSITPVTSTLKDLELFSEGSFQIDDDEPLAEGMVVLYQIFLFSINFGTKRS
jgi:hypothetical protein